MFLFHLRKGIKCQFIKNLSLGSFQSKGRFWLIIWLWTNMNHLKCFLFSEQKLFFFIFKKCWFWWIRLQRKPNFYQILKKVYFFLSPCSKLTRQIDRSQNAGTLLPRYFFFLKNLCYSVFHSYSYIIIIFSRVEKFPSGGLLLKL